MHALYCGRSSANAADLPCKKNWRANLKMERERALAARDAADAAGAREARRGVGVAPPPGPAADGPDAPPEPRNVEYEEDLPEDAPVAPPRYRRQPIIRNREVREPPRLAHARHTAPFRRRAADL